MRDDRQPDIVFQSTHAYALTPLHTLKSTHTYTQTVRQNESNWNRNGGVPTWLDSKSICTFYKRHAFKTFSNQFNSTLLIAMYREYKRVMIWTFNRVCVAGFFPILFLSVCLIQSAFIPVLSLNFYSTRRRRRHFFFFFNLSH